MSDSDMSNHSNPDANADAARWRAAVLVLGSCHACSANFRDACAPSPRSTGCALCAPARFLLREAESASPSAPGSDDGAPREACTITRGNDCDGACATVCFRCGMPACATCSVVLDHPRHGRHRFGLDCLDDMARFGELDYLTLAPSGARDAGEGTRSDDGSGKGGTR